jgi:hypothetical protein
MYSENNRRSANRRADNEFLRRMAGGDLIGNGYPVVNMNEISNQSHTPVHASSPAASCNEMCRGDRPSLDCPTTLSAPALAMVYCPKQCFRKLLSPQEGLKSGTIFSELVFPLEAASKNRYKEVNPRRCL